MILFIRLPVTNSLQMKHGVQIARFFAALICREVDYKFQFFSDRMGISLTFFQIKKKNEKVFETLSVTNFVSSP